MIDIHCHTKYGGHCEGSITDCVNSANHKNLKILGFSEHFPLPSKFYDPAGDSAMLPESLQTYLKDVEKERTNSQMGLDKVLVGLEVDFIPRFRKDISKNLEELRVDYLIGSIHFIDGWNFDYNEETFKTGLEKRYKGNEKKVVNDYFNLVREMIQSDLFQIVGHLDLIKKFNLNGIYFDESESYYTNWVKEILKLVKKKDLIIEVNSAGLDKKVKEQYPSKWVIKECYERKIPVTMGSDAHRPSEIGRYFDKITRMLNDIGYKRLVYFLKRKKIERQLILL